VTALEMLCYLLAYFCVGVLAVTFVSALTGWSKP
jgi:hypothetical protein